MGEVVYTLIGALFVGIGIYGVANGSPFLGGCLCALGAWLVVDSSLGPHDMGTKGAVFCSCEDGSSAFTVVCALNSLEA